VILDSLLEVWIADRFPLPIRSAFRHLSKPLDTIGFEGFFSLPSFLAIRPTDARLVNRPSSGALLAGAAPVKSSHRLFLP